MKKQYKRKLLLLRFTDIDQIGSITLIDLQGASHSFPLGLKSKDGIIGIYDILVPPKPERKEGEK